MTECALPHGSRASTTDQSKIANAEPWVAFRHKSSPTDLYNLRAPAKAFDASPSRFKLYQVYLVRRCVRRVMPQAAAKESKYLVREAGKVREGVSLVVKVPVRRCHAVLWILSSSTFQAGLSLVVVCKSIPHKKFTRAFDQARYFS